MFPHTALWFYILLSWFPWEFQSPIFKTKPKKPSLLLGWRSKQRIVVEHIAHLSSFISCHRRGDKSRPSICLWVKGRKRLHNAIQLKSIHRLTYIHTGWIRVRRFVFYIFRLNKWFVNHICIVRWRCSVPYSHQCVRILAKHWETNLEVDKNECLSIFTCMYSVRLNIVEVNGFQREGRRSFSYGFQNVNPEAFA